MSAASMLKSLLPLRVNVGKNVDNTNVHIGSSTVNNAQNGSIKSAQSDFATTACYGLGLIAVLAIILWIYRLAKSGKQIRQLITGVQNAKKYVSEELKESFNGEMEKYHDEDTKATVNKIKGKINGRKNSLRNNRQDSSGNNTEASTGKSEDDDSIPGGTQGGEA